MIRTLLAVLSALCLLAPALRANEPPMRIYIDADFTTSYQVGTSIALGIHTALHEADFQIAGVPLQLVDRNHKGDVDRSLRTLQSYHNDDQALAVFGGMHSPPYLTHRGMINKLGILTLLPWSAAGPITRADKGVENWIFRLSVDDSKAGEFLANWAVQKSKCRNIALLLMDSDWGRVNRTVITAALQKHGIEPIFVTLFDSALGQRAAEDIAAHVRDQQGDCVILLAQATEAALLSQAFHALNHRITMLSHWAILGARYDEDVSHLTREFIGLHILQTCGLNVDKANTSKLTTALSHLDGRFASLNEVSAPAGFVHGYDLTRVFLAAAEQAAATAAWSGTIEDRRRAIKDALEQLDTPVEGILKTYDPPFAPYSASKPDAHEALGGDDLCMARYTQDGHLEHAPI